MFGTESAGIELNGFESWGIIVKTALKENANQKPEYRKRCVLLCDFQSI